ncbi:hypothetical protein QUF80_03825 [Desulfococcaceae bacterium HSG8]|nr:hypothetical protein [Desulfococcaceae bacterium HSG8]
MIKEWGKNVKRKDPEQFSPEYKQALHSCPDINVGAESRVFHASRFTR